jgi:hypothetical protein
MTARSRPPAEARPAERRHLDGRAEGPLGLGNARDGAQFVTLTPALGGQQARRGAR